MTHEPYLWTPPPLASLAVRGRAVLAPVRRIFCVARNYQAHAVEMGAPVDKSTMRPMYFCKDRSALVPSGATIPYPPGTENFQFEMELVVLIGKPGLRVSVAQAAAMVFGYTAGLDMTRRDLQLAARHHGQPWDLGKNAENSAICGEIVAAADCTLQPDAAICLELNGALRQNSTLSKMIWSVGEVIADLSRFYHLQPGDLIFTGTPEGVGAVKPGDRIHGRIEGIGSVEVEIGAPD